MWPCRTVRSEPRTVGVSPAQEASLRADPNRVMSPASARMTRAVKGPTPGSWARILTRGPDRARWRTSASSRAGRHLQGAGQGQVVLDHLPRDRREIERGEPAPAGAAPAA